MQYMFLRLTLVLEDSETVAEVDGDLDQPLLLPNTSLPNRSEKGSFDVGVLLSVEDPKGSGLFLEGPLEKGSLFPLLS